MQELIGDRAVVTNVAPAPVAMLPRTSSRQVLPTPPGPCRKNTENGRSAGFCAASRNNSISADRPTNRARRRAVRTSPSVLPGADPMPITDRT
jgi:hypothetical protein